MGSAADRSTATYPVDTDANSTFEALFQPGFIAGIELRSRVLMAPMEKNLCTSTGVVTQRYIDYLVARARHEVGLLRVEATYVDPVGKGRPFQLGAQADHVLPELERMVAAVHDAGGRLSLELAHCGRQSSSQISGFQPVAPSPVPCEASGGWMPRELTVTEIAAIVERFAAAAQRIEKAGVDIVEIHGASGYLLNAFLSPYTNLREDEYGGSFENRMRFPLEVVDAIRGAVSVPVTYRLDAEECVPGGLTVADTAPFAAELERHGIAMIDAAAGTYEAILATQPPMEVPPGSLLEIGAAIKAAVESIPVATTGRLGALEVAEDAVARGVVDFVSIARGLHADPALLTKAKEGRIREARRCIACAECVAFLSEKETAAYCAINPAAIREAEFEPRPAVEARRVLVVGAGPAGMEAARVAALRGHEVTVCEREERVGGRVRQGELAPGRRDFGESVRFLARELDRLEVPVRLGTEVTAGLVAELGPDVVLLATGATQPEPKPIAGLDQEHVTDAFTFLRRLEADPDAARGEGPVAVLGGNWVGCVVTSILLDAGRKVALIETRDELAYDFSMQPAMPMMDLLANHPDVTVHLRTTVEAIGAGEVETWAAATDQAQSIPAAEVIVVPALEANPTLRDELGDAAPEVHMLGDCVKPRKLQDAILEGAEVALRI
ncbi:MAG: FAD-dependent oxidoreductase [Actinobacteria bacterium]|nr:FAD-dependent oxidoreductase [Actinomycetota bacterium]